MISLVRDVRYAARVLRHSPGFTAAAMLTMAVGVGATVAIFAVVSAVLLRPLPFAGADRIIAVGGARRDAPGRLRSVSLEDLRDWQRQSRTIAAFAAWRDWGMKRYDDKREKSLYAAIVTPGIFQVFPVKPVVGRLFRPDDDVPGRNRLLLLTYDYWRTRFGGDRGVPGRTMVLEREDKAIYTIIGVLPPQFSELPSFDEIKVLTLSSTDPDAATGRGHRNRRVFARLRDGASLRDARAEMNVIAVRLASQYPASNDGWSVAVQSLVDHEVGPMANTLRAFFVSVGFILLIACANIAALQLARTLARRREFAVRRSLGGGRLAIVSEIAAESALLSVGGGMIGLLGARWLIQVVLHVGPAIPRAEPIPFDGAVILFVLAVLLASGLALAVPASWLVSRVDPASAMKEESGRVAGASAAGVRTAFVVAQVGIAVMLLSGALVAGRAVVEHLIVRPGFDPAGLASVQMSAPLEKYKTGPEVTRLLTRVVEEVRALPAVGAASAVSALPTSGEGAEPVDLIVATAGAGPAGHITANFFNVTPGYFRTLGVPLLRGRDFTDRDSQGTPGVAIVNETFVRRYLGSGRDPLLARLRFASGGEELNIVGVAGDVLQDLKPRAVAQPEIYWPYTQRPRWAAFVVVRSQSPGGAIAAVRAGAKAIDQDISVGTPRTVSDAIWRSSRGPRFLLLMFGLFAAIAALLSATGVYGLASYTFAQRTREIAVRISIGATPRDIVRLVAASGFTAVAVGCVFGFAGTFVVTRTTASMLPQMEPLPPVVGILAGVFLAVLGGFACYLPARRALRVDPVSVLRAP